MTGTAPEEKESSEPSEIVLAFRTDVVASRLATGKWPPEFTALIDNLKAAGLILEQMHPHANAPDLVSWYRVLVSRNDDIQPVLAALRASAIVAAAYVKPSEAPPR